MACALLVSASKSCCPCLACCVAFVNKAITKPQSCIDRKGCNIRLANGLLCILLCWLLKTACALQDYETAQSTLKLLASDYKTDKAYKHLAGVQASYLST